MSDTKRTMYTLNLHEMYIVEDKGIEITRVPGGWLYHYLFRKDTIFVPYTDEFNQVAKKRAAMLRQLQMAPVSH